MKKMLIIGILIGITIGGTLTGVVAYNYNASNVSYEPTDDTWNVNNVEDALKSLRENKSIDLSNYNKSNNQYNQNLGAMTTKSTSLTLNQGEYIVLVTSDSGYNTTTTNTGTSDINYDEYMSYDQTKCSLYNLSAKGYNSRATSLFNGMYSITSFGSVIYYVKIKELTTLSFNPIVVTDNKIAYGITMTSIKLK